ncbi:carboxylate-amine ligase [Granulosicoccus antarcticus]|uniref:Putative glutamate--cysteine ligase 2 n=1 Tax=Granulosicoccus antarcticus IMCC3135 TaxID=1192854 RepID=A0A2Z2NKM1_9GAMM|nr:carboxylate-amine ligase [Granulosicoccus antarcticus]ASJ71065.1 Putative glutamate--cysteine ligase 2 [Granulosicoccus antarcticus IMCC3135]
MADTVTIGIEEEYLLVNPQSRELAKHQAAGFMDRCKALLGDRVMHEMLQSQIEIGTGVCSNMAQARSELVELRQGVASVARDFDLCIIAASTHPWSLWSEQEPVDMERYRIMGVEQASIARRMAICGMHVHAGIPDKDLRIDLMNQVSYFMPHLLALSGSSPFWEGIDTGLKSMRPTIAGHLPRSGLPEKFDNWNDWLEMIDDMTACGMINDPSRIWWDLRPSVRHPTLEIRICDVCTWVEDAVSVAAIYQSLLTFLTHLKSSNQRWRQYRRILILENKWRAQRYGVDAMLGDFGKREAVAFPELIDELVELLRPHAETLDCVKEVEHAREIARRGASSDQQLRVYNEMLAKGSSDREAQVAVVDWLIAESVPPVDTHRPVAQKERQAEIS